MVGRTVGRFRVVAKLGQGGMGTVWKAEDTLLGRAVALKFLPPGLMDSPAARRRFVREARATSGLDHPGIATLYDAGESEGQFYIAIAWVDGCTVSDLLARGPLPVAEAVRVAVAVADALAHAHGRGVIHRDVTARNVMVARDGRVMLIDFGIARRTDATTTSASGTIGTAAYVAPEVLRGRATSERSDLYALGVVLYQMLTGDVPFRGEQADAILYAAAHEEAEPPGARVPGIPAALEALVMRALSKQPAARHADAPAFAQALRDFARDHLPADAQPAAAPPPPLRRRRAPGTRASATGRVRSGRRVLAVLPFRNLEVTGEADAAGQVFAGGLAEALCAGLSRVPQLHVLAPSPAFHEPEFQRDLAAAAERIGATLLLTGTVQRTGSHLRATFSLVDPHRGKQLGGEVVDGAATDLFGFEDALHAAVVKALRLEDVSRARRPARLQGSAAHEQYLQALGYMQRSDNEASVDGAIRLLEGLIASEGDTVLVHSVLARAYVRKGDITREAAWRTRAEKSCKIALGLDPHSPEVLVTLGRVQLAEGHPQEAAGTLRRAIELRESSSDAWMYLARALRAQGKLAEAEPIARRAVALAPHLWGAHQELASVHFRQGRFDDSAESFRRVVELTPDSASGFANLGAALFRMDRLEAAHDAFRRSVELLPKPLGLSNLGTVSFFLGRFAEAAEMFERALSLQPRDPRLWANLADAFRALGMPRNKSDEAYDRAIALMREHLEEHATDADGWAYLARWRAKRGDSGGAHAALARGLQLGAENVGCAAQAIIVFELGGDRARALEYLGRAVQGGYGTIELERDPDLAPLFLDPNAQRILREGRSSRPGMESPPPKEP